MAFENDPDLRADVEALAKGTFGRADDGSDHPLNHDPKVFKVTKKRKVPQTEEITWLIANRSAWAGWPDRFVFFNNDPGDTRRLADFRARFPFTLPTQDGIAFSQASLFVMHARQAIRDAYISNVAGSEFDDETI